MTDALLLAAVPISTHAGARGLTNASGFFFERGERLFLVTSRHVLIDEPTGHHPDRIGLVLHLDATNLTRTAGFSIPLFRNGKAVWRQGRDSGGEIDVAVIEIDRAALPEGVLMHSFTPEHLQDSAAYDEVEIGSALLVVGFPLGFRDTLHHLAVVRQAAVASAFGVRFQGQGYFLTDARTHRGTSGAAVVMRMPVHDGSAGPLPWKLLGVHSGRLDMMPRDAQHDEVLGLNCAWYADILLTLTKPMAATVPGPAAAPVMSQPPSTSAAQ
jgi:Trypsin-like peptidase domain